MRCCRTTSLESWGWLPLFSNEIRYSRRYFTKKFGWHVHVWISKLQASNSEYKDSCFHHLQTLFVEGSLVRQLFLLFFLLLTHTFCLFRCIEPFPYCLLSESDCLIFHLLLFLWCLDFVCQLLGSYGGHFLVVDSVKWAILRPQTENLQLTTPGQLFPSSANFVCQREPCPTTIFTFFLLLTHAFCLFRRIGLSYLVRYLNRVVWFQCGVIFLISLFC